MNKKEQIVARISSFPTLPVMANKLLHALNNPETAASEIAAIVQIDPALTANVLKAANSSYLGYRRQAESLSEATFRLGTKWIYQIALSSLIQSNLQRPARGYNLSGEDLWKHSIACAIMSESTCKLIQVADSGMIYTAALLHDMGKIVMGEFVAGEFDNIQNAVVTERIPFAQAEEAVLGVSHTEVGALIAESWRFPKQIVNCIRWHHDPDQLEPNDQAVDIVHVADCICLMEGLGLGRDDLQYRLSQKAYERLKLTSGIVEFAISQTLTNLEDIEKMLNDCPTVMNVGR